MKRTQRIFIILVICALLSGCSGPQAGTSNSTEPNAPVSGNAAVKAEAGQEVKISADGKVTAGDRVLSEGGQGSLATGCDITVMTDGTIVVSTEKGDYSVHRNYTVTIPAQTAMSVQVSTPDGQTLEVNGSGFSVGQVTVTGAGIVETSQGAITKEEDKVVFSTDSGNYTIVPAGVQTRSMRTWSARTVSCQVMTPTGEVLEVREPLPILGGNVTILPDGSVKTNEGIVSMLQNDTTITTPTGVYTVSQEEIVLVEETTMVLEVAVLDPDGNVVLTDEDGAAIIEAGSVTVQGDGSLLTSSGIVSVDRQEVIVKPLEEEQKTMTLPNGKVIDISKATTQEDGSLFIPEDFTVYPSTPERIISPDGFMTEQRYFKKIPDSKNGYTLTEKDDPDAVRMTVKVKDLHFATMPLLENKEVDLLTNAVTRQFTYKLNDQGVKIWEEKITPNFPREILQYDDLGRMVEQTKYDDENLPLRIYKWKYLTDNAGDLRCEQTEYDAYGNLADYYELDQNGLRTYGIQYSYQDGEPPLPEYFYYKDGNIIYKEVFHSNGEKELVTFPSDGTQIHTRVESAGGRFVTNKDASGRTIKEQYFYPDGSTDQYIEYAYNVDGWTKIAYKQYINTNLIHEDINRVEVYENVAQRMELFYKTDGTLNEKMVCDLATGDYYIYDGQGNLIKVDKGNKSSIMP